MGISGGHVPLVPLPYASGDIVILGFWDVYSSLPELPMIVADEE